MRVRLSKKATYYFKNSNNKTKQYNYNKSYNDNNNNIITIISMHNYKVKIGESGLRIS